MWSKDFLDSFRNFYFKLVLGVFQSFHWEIVNNDSLATTPITIFQTCTISLSLPLLSMYPLFLWKWSVSLISPVLSHVPWTTIPVSLLKQFRGLKQNISKFLSNIVDSLPMHSAYFSSVPQRYENSYRDLIIFLGIRIAISINFIRIFPKWSWEVCLYTHFSDPCWHQD